MSIYSLADSLRASPVGRYIGETFDNINFVSREAGANEIATAAAFGGTLALTLLVNNFAGVSLGRSLIEGTAGTVAGLIVSHAVTGGLVHVFNRCVEKARGY